MPARRALCLALFLLATLLAIPASALPPAQATLSPGPAASAQVTRPPETRLGRIKAAIGARVQAVRATPSNAAAALRRFAATVHRSVPIEESTDGLIIVDLQKDFTPGGALGVAGGDQVVREMSRLARLFAKSDADIYASRDWHPPDHSSFQAQGGPWPEHGVAGTDGAKFHPALVLPRGTTIINKGTDRDKEAYSAFAGTDLAERLRAKGTTRLFIGGVATDYCVRATVLDGLKEGFEVYFIKNASAAVNLNPSDEKNAIKDMVASGAKIIDSSRLKAE
jgi:nicotinamidase/pyrazinamidase